jgi:enoyl-CoA hydratase/carnithine racemase
MEPPELFQSPVDELTRTAYEVSPEGVAVITLRRPEKLNAFDAEMLRELKWLFWRVAFDDSVRCLVITGSGRGFCAGRDIPGLRFENGLETPQYRAYVRANHEVFDDLEALEKVTIAAVNGVCAGGGVELAVACDLRVAAADAEFLLPETRLGVIPASGACSRMVQLIGAGRVKEMVLLAERIGARRAYEIGLVNRVVDEDGDVLACAQELARKALDLAPQAVGMAKHVIGTSQSLDMASGRVLERLGQSVLIRTSDAQDGMAAFEEKRKPEFDGR